MYYIQMTEKESTSNIKFREKGFTYKGIEIVNETRTKFKS